MIAAVLEKPQTFEMVRVAVPEVKDNEIKIQVEGCGICASSLPVWQGREWFTYPMTAGAPGHEGWGTVTAVGASVQHIRPGNRVAYLSGNSYAEYDVATADAAVVLPDSLAGIPFPGEPLGCAINIFERSQINAGETVAIVGIGFLGALLCQLANKAGAKVIAISRRPYSLEVAKQYGAHHTIAFNSTWEVANTVAELTSGGFCTKVIEATGKQEGLDVAIELIAEGGRLMIAGYHQDGLRQVNMQKWNWKGIDVINAHERKPEKYIEGMQKAIAAVEQGIINPGPLYTHRLPLSQVAEGFRFTTNRTDGFIKALVMMN